MTTTTVYADAADGQIGSNGDEWNLGATYADTRAGSGTGVTLAASTAGASILVGQQYDTDGSSYATFGVWESFLGFDTSSIDDGDTVSAAVLNVTSSDDLSATDFTIQARLKDWSTTVTTADWVAGADLSGLTLLATKTTSSGFTANSAYDFSDSAMPANVNKTGVTRMLLCSSRTVGNNAPTGNEYVGAKSADTTGTTSDPKLTVTHAAAGGTTVTPTTLSLTTTGYAPTVTATANQTVTPTTASLALTGFAPTVTTSSAQTVTPTTAALTTTGYAPTVTATAHQTVTPTTAALTVTTYAPTVTAGGAQTVTPTTTSLALVTYAPTVTATAHQTVTPTTAALTLSTFAPSVNIGINVVPTTKALTLSTFAPTVTTTAHQVVTPTTAALTLATFAPTVTATDPKVVTPGPLALTLTTYAPYVGSQLITGGRGPRPGTAHNPVPRGTAVHHVPGGLS